MRIDLPRRCPRLWHRWYAWHPIVVARTFIWLEPVWRVQRMDRDGPFWDYWLRKDKP
jgi:hypothetical protein